MKNFLDEEFLLSNSIAKQLFFDAAMDMPIFDFHNHLSAKEIYEDKQFSTITEVWLGSDHYKWRMMRTMGFTQDQIVGTDTSDFEKFKMWAKTVENLFGNPLYHWTHLELQRYFSIYEPLTSNNAKEIYEKCNEMLNDKNFSVRNLLRKMNVYELCTTNNPDEDLKYHKLLSKENNLGFIVTPSFRPDLNLVLSKFKDFTSKYGKIYGKEVTSIKDFISFLENRINLFINQGCKITDHALNVISFTKACTLDNAKIVWDKLLEEKEITDEESTILFGALMIEMGKIYNKYNLAQQYHIGAFRNSNKKMYKKYGPDVGYDFIEDGRIAQSIQVLMDALDYNSQLPKTILYNLNPRDNDILVTLAGCFQDGITKGKIQYGSAWWFLDNKYGMERQIESLANNGMLSTFIGMLTDSRSFLSYPRHEYFRRILCNYIGAKVENGEFPHDIKYLSQMVKNICFYNVKEYLEA